MDRGLVDTCLWERRRITIPPHLGYGASGVGAVIPPHATLVFYIRLIKIERGGIQLQKDVSLEDLWLAGMEAYRTNEWQTVIDQLEEAIRAFDAYQNATLLCLQQCSQNGPPQLSDKDKETMKKYAGGTEDHLFLQFLTYAAKARCVRECKAEALTPNQRYPDPEILVRLKNRDPYSFLHFAYYQLGDFKEGAKCFFTFMFHNMNSDLIPGNDRFYRKTLEWGRMIIECNIKWVWSTCGRLSAGLKAYDQENFLETVDLIESSLPLYREALDRCLLLCEDMLVMNTTEPDMSDGMREILDYYKPALAPDTLDYHSVLTFAVRELLECRVRCHDDVARVRGEVLGEYLPHHFHYLQFSYYKLGQLLKAAECAATYLSMAPSDEVMLHNIRYFTNNYKLRSEDFVPREEYVAIVEKLATEKRLLHFAAHGEPLKKQGRRGDWEPKQKHEEL
ncbi:Cartilage-associated protein [Geodia barretti]|uniref:peptidylprolyl isomerase n=1 Tax=Geodia barretti TaxID=519541 RepID=A0AA35XFC9_GEOBA|nr:Cartilage-associated protein [Geodia barretti]